MNMDDGDACWCCGTPQPREGMLHLGNYPEVNVCVPCAHFLHKQANGLEDEARNGIGPRTRDVVRRARRGVVGRGWHRSPIFGRPVTWIGRRLP